MFERLGFQLQDPGLVLEELHPLGARCGVVPFLSVPCLFLLGGGHGATDLGPPRGERCLFQGDLRRLAEELRSPQRRLGTLTRKVHAGNGTHDR